MSNCSKQFTFYEIIDYDMASLFSGIKSKILLTTSALIIPLYLTELSGLEFRFLNHIKCRLSFELYQMLEFTFHQVQFRNISLGSYFLFHACRLKRLIFDQLSVCHLRSQRYQNHFHYLEVQPGPQKNVQQNFPPSQCQSK